MINIDTLTLGNPFKDDNGNIYEVTSNFSEKGKIFVELTQRSQEEELIEET